MASHESGAVGASGCAAGRPASQAALLSASWSSSDERRKITLQLQVFVPGLQMQGAASSQQTNIRRHPTPSFKEDIWSLIQFNEDVAASVVLTNQFDVYHSKEIQFVQLRTCLHERCRCNGFTANHFDFTLYHSTSRATQPLNYRTPHQNTFPGYDSNQRIDTKSFCSQYGLYSCIGE